MKNITITLDAETATWLRVQAAEKNMSVSRWVSELLSERMQHKIEYQRAMRAYFSVNPTPLRSGDEPLPTREELYDRPRIR